MPRVGWRRRHLDDLFFFDQPFFEDGPLAITAAAAVAAGVSYHTSAANYGNGKYLAEDYRAGPEDFHDFDPGPGQNILNLVAVPPCGVLRCFLQWADPFGASSNDYDLFAVEPATITILASSEDPQTGFEDPRETVFFANPLASLLVVGLAIQRFDGAPVALKLLCPDPGTPLEWSSSQFGISGHAARPEVLAVAAINALDPGLDDVEPFSMQGPAPIFFPSMMFRPKPDLAAFDGVATTLPGGVQSVLRYIGSRSSFGRGCRSPAEQESQPLAVPGAKHPHVDCRGHRCTRFR